MCNGCWSLRLIFSKISKVGLDLLHIPRISQGATLRLINCLWLSNEIDLCICKRSQHTRQSWSDWDVEIDCIPMSQYQLPVPLVDPVRSERSTHTAILSTARSRTITGSRWTSLSVWHQSYWTTVLWTSCPFNPEYRYEHMDIQWRRDRKQDILAYRVSQWHQLGLVCMPEVKTPIKQN